MKKKEENNNLLRRLTHAISEIFLQELLAIKHHHPWLSGHSTDKPSSVLLLILLLLPLDECR
jgi:hypothetical protein